MATIDVCGAGTSKEQLDRTRSHFAVCIIAFGTYYTMHLPANFALFSKVFCRKQLESELGLKCKCSGATILVNITMLLLEFQSRNVSIV